MTKDDWGKNLKDYARCCVKNRATLGGLIGISLAPVGFYFGARDGMEPLLLGTAAVNLFSLMALIKTELGTDTLMTYWSVSKTLEARGEEYIRKEIHPKQYCNKVGFEMVIEDYQRQQEK